MFSISRPRVLQRWITVVNLSGVDLRRKSNFTSKERSKSGNISSFASFSRFGQEMNSKNKSYSNWDLTLHSMNSFWRWLVQYKVGFVSILPNHRFLSELHLLRRSFSSFKFSNPFKSVPADFSVDDWWESSQNDHITGRYTAIGRWLIALFLFCLGTHFVSEWNVLWDSRGRHKDPTDNYYT